MSDDDFDPDFDDFDDFDDDEGSLDDHESAMIQQDLSDLADFEATFRAEGFRGVAVFCQDCVEEHYYPWDMLRENLRLLLETGETPVHEPAFSPEPDRYVPWDYARGYVDALREVGVDQRGDVHQCQSCGYHLAGEVVQGNFCPRCGAPLLRARLTAALEKAGLDDDAVLTVLRQVGLPT